MDWVHRVHVGATYSKPDMVSAAVGTLGNCDIRFAVHTENAVTAPLLAGSIRSEEFPKCISTDLRERLAAQAVCPETAHAPCPGPPWWPDRDWTGGYWFWCPR